jgi:autotransporter-associated beta strand protein
VVPIKLNPTGSPSSDALGTDGSKQVGWATSVSSSGTVTIVSPHAEEWSGTAASAFNLNPAGFSNSTAYGVNGNQVVGSGTRTVVTPSGTGQNDALLWNTASTTPGVTAVDLNPVGFSGSTAYGTDTANQVGFGIPSSSTGTTPVSPHALLWSGSAASAVDLNPTGFTASYANGVANDSVLPAGSGGATGNQEVGYGIINGKANALLWTGTAASAVDLNPTSSATNASTQSYAEGTNGNQQVGWESNGNVSAATLWYGTAASAVNLNSLLPTRGKWASSTAHTINPMGDIYGTATGTINGITSTYAVEWVPRVLTPVAYAGTTASATWDISSTTDFTAGASATSYQDGDSVSFGDTGSSTNNVTLVAGPGDASNPGYLTPSAVTVNSASTYNFSGAGIAGVGGFTKSGTGTVIISNTNTYAGPTAINQGTVLLTPTGSISNSVATVGDGTHPATLTLQAGTGVTVQTLAGLNITSTGTVTFSPSAGTASRTLLVVGTGGFTNAGSLDLANNAMDIQNGNLAAVTSMVRQGYSNAAWTGPGITSSTAAADGSHLTAVGVITNSVDGINPLYGSGAPLGLFVGTSPAATDVLVSYTYYGDANLDGKVDGSDYSLLDNGYLNHLSGWYNGDFNYDGIIDGSDYTLIDNAYNTQGAALDAAAASTSQIATGTSAVPEPASVGLACLGASGLLLRRRRRATCRWSGKPGGQGSLCEQL